MAAERVAPDEITDVVNLDGTVDDIDDDPDSPDGNWLTATATDENTSVLVRFATPASPVLFGADKQEFKVQVRRSPASANREPTFRCWLSDNGVSIRLLGTEQIGSGNHVFAYTWAGEEAPSSEDGSNVELLMSGQVSIGNPSQIRTVEYGAVEWNSETGPNDGFTD